MNVNIAGIAALIVLGIKVTGGYRKGMVREIVSLLSLIVLCIVAALGVNGVRSYVKGEFLTVVVMVVLLFVLVLVHRLLNLVLFPAKLIAKLPVIHLADKLLGAALGALETVLLLWTVYTFVMLTDSGMTGQMILQYTSESTVLTWLYEHNYLARWIQLFGVQLAEKLQIL